MNRKKEKGKQMYQIDYLMAIKKDKVVEGTYNGIPFKGKVMETYVGSPWAKCPISFTLELATPDVGMPMEETGYATFYAQDVREDKGRILQLSSVNAQRSRYSRRSHR